MLINREKYNRIATSFYANTWQYFYRYRRKLIGYIVKHKGVLSCIAVLLFLVLSWLVEPCIRERLEPLFSEDSQYDSLKLIFIGVGSALVGATAIVFSLIMFAMQVNVERVPYGLFKKLSSDKKLIVLFVVALGLSIILMLFSLVNDISLIAYVTLAALWIIIAISVVFLASYTRALDLINPARQLSILIMIVNRSLKIWAKAASRTAPIMMIDEGEKYKQDEENNTCDMGRAAYFYKFGHWDSDALNGVQYCDAISRQYSEHRDYEVSGLALSAIVAINASYIEAKGKTFFGDALLYDNPFSTDKFINGTLERLRQHVKIAISRGDEQQIELLLKTLADLCKLYMRIKYIFPEGAKKHANLAASYLANSVESVPPSMTDVLMEGFRIFGGISQISVQSTSLFILASLSSKMGVIASNLVVNSEYFPAVKVAMEQLSGLSLSMIINRFDNVRYSIIDIRTSIKMISENAVAVPDNRVIGGTTECLSPYYSITNSVSFATTIAKLVNDIIDLDEAGNDGKQMINRIVQWSDQLYIVDRGIFLLAIKNESQFTLEMMQWITHIAEVLIALSNANVCSASDQNSLRKTAFGFLAIFSWVPDDPTSIAFVEGFKPAEKIFKSAVNAYRRGCDEIASKLGGILLRWAIKTSKYRTAWREPEDAFCCVACLAIILKFDEDAFHKYIVSEMENIEVADQNQIISIANYLRRKSTDFLRENTVNVIEATMASIDQEKLRESLITLAEKLESVARSA